MKFVLLALVVGLVAIAVGRLSTSPEGGRRQRKALETSNQELRAWGLDAYAAIQQLRELAWQHRDIAPEFATIMLDEIAKREQSLRNKLPRGVL